MSPGRLLQMITIRLRGRTRTVRLRMETMFSEIAPVNAHTGFLVAVVFLFLLLLLLLLSFSSLISSLLLNYYFCFV